MIFKEEVLETPYYSGMKYHYNGSELDKLSPKQRDRHASTILIINRKEVLFKTEVEKHFDENGKFSHFVIVTKNYKPAAFISEIED